MKKLFWLLTAIPLVLIHQTEAQQQKKIPRLAYLAGVSTNADEPRLEAFREALRGYGYIEGQKILIETRHEGRDLERLPDEAAELVGRKPDIFVAVTTNAALAAKKAAGAIPLVFYGCDRPCNGGPGRKPGSTRGEYYGC